MFSNSSAGIFVVKMWIRNKDVIGDMKQGITSKTQTKTNKS